ncbi:MAG: hypothetical protein H6707_03370 [Deltaproteobacteria bacterium]|nr:hypothetical protein [Deltaproteobacteria bacterium]
MAEKSASANRVDIKERARRALLSKVLRSRDLGDDLLERVRAELGPKGAELEAAYWASPAQQDNYRSVAVRGEAAPNSENLNSSSYLSLLLVRGGLDLDRLRACVQRIFERHEALRTTLYVGTFGRVVALVWKPRPVRWCVRDITTLPGWGEVTPAVVAGRYMGERVSVVWSAEDHGFFGVEVIVNEESGTFYVIFETNRLTFDRSCWDTLSNELKALYGADDPASVELPAAPSPGEYNRWMMEQVAADVAAHWRERFPPDFVPSSIADPDVDLTKPANEPYRDFTTLLTGDVPLLDEAARLRRVPWWALPLGATGLALAHRCKAKDFVTFRFDDRGRDPRFPDCSTVIGNYSRLLPIRLPVRRDMKLEAYLRAVVEEEAAMSRYSLGLSTKEIMNLVEPTVKRRAIRRGQTVTPLLFSCRRENWDEGTDLLLGLETSRTLTRSGTSRVKKMAKQGRSDFPKLASAEAAEEVSDDSLAANDKLYNDVKGAFFDSQLISKYYPVAPQRGNALRLEGNAKPSRVSDEGMEDFFNAWYVALMFLSVADAETIGEIFDAIEA